MKPPKFEDYDPFKPEPRRRPFVKFFLGAFVVAAGVSAYGLYRLSLTMPQAPAILPAETPILISLTPGVAALGGLPALKRAYPQVFSWDGFQDFRARCERDLGLNFEQDVAPWLGTEVAVAISKPEELSKERATLLFASHNDGKAREALAKVRLARAAKGEEASPETYEGVAYDRYPGGQALGVVGGFVVWADTEPGFRGIVDRAQHRAPKTLANDPEYRTLLHQLPGNAVGRIFISQAAGKRGLPAHADAYLGFAGGVVLRSDAVVFQTVAHVAPQRLPEPFRDHLEDLRQPVDPKLLDAMPADAISAASFRLPPGTADALKGYLAEELGKLPDARRAQRDAGVDLERDLASWLEGEVALGLVPGKLDRDVPLEGALVMRPKDVAAAQAGLDKLRQAFTRSTAPSLPGGRQLPAPMAFQEQTHGGATWQVLHDALRNRDLGGYAISGDKLYMAYGPATLDQGGKPPQPLTKAPAFKDATAALPHPNGGVAYWDVAGSFTLALPYLGRAADTLEPALRPVQAIAAAGTPGLSDEGYMRSTVVVRVVSD